MTKSKYADRRWRIPRVPAAPSTKSAHSQIRPPSNRKNTYVFWTTDIGAWPDVYPDAGYRPFRGTKASDS